MSTPDNVLVRAMAANATIRCMATITTNLVNQACQRHSTLPTASAALGRVLTGTLMMGSLLKDLEKITVQFHCQGPIGNITAEADAYGNVRGYVRNPSVDLPVNEKGKLDVGKAVGEGMLYVIRDAGFDIGLGRDPYCGSVPIVSGEIAMDLAYYFTKSEQIPSDVSLGVFVEKDGIVTAAGGFIIQVMPGADEKLVSEIANSVAQTPPSTTMIRSGYSAVDMLRQALGKVDFEILSTNTINFTCQCSYERAISLISALGKEEVSDMLEKDKGAKLTCHFCSETYSITIEDLEMILNSLN
ncbi:MAG: Hsp33 family molecular chaperone HslO [Blastocatellia bacterium]|nr:Hsp33 family molecular chaperone HslO [Blastocatellia bacterium]MBL8193249.1 Hsp33 family molecular chaperone HslO [Blastocatellia bacterium]